VLGHYNSDSGFVIIVTIKVIYVVSSSYFGGGGKFYNNITLVNLYVLYTLELYSILNGGNLLVITTITCPSLNINCTPVTIL
jgi:hypothetical protein